MGERFKNKVIIVTGAGRGIGAATAHALAAESASVVICGRTEADLKKTASAANHIRYFVCDIKEERQVHALFEFAIKEFGRIDGLVNNAAIYFSSDFAETELADWENLMAVNVRGSFLCAREAFRRMKGGGSIVNVSSRAGVRGPKKFKGMAAYITSKFALVGLTEALAEDGRAFGIRANCVVPGATETPMLRKAFPDAQNVDQPETVAQLILSLMDEKQSAEVTGAIMEITPRPLDQL